MIAILFCILGLVYSKIIDHASNNPIATALVGYFFFTIGYFFKRVFQIKLDVFSQKWPKISRVLLFAAGVCCLVVLWFTAMKNTVSIDMNTSRYGINWIFVANALLGTLGTFFIAYAVMANKVLEFYGKNSLILLVMHTFVFKAIGILLERMGVLEWYNALATFVIMMVFSTIAVIIINRFLPVLAGKITMEKNK